MFLWLTLLIIDMFIAKSWKSLFRPQAKDAVLVFDYMLTLNLCEGQVFSLFDTISFCLKVLTFIWAL